MTTRGKLQTEILAISAKSYGLSNTYTVLLTFYRGQKISYTEFINLLHSEGLKTAMGHAENVFAYGKSIAKLEKLSINSYL